MHNLSDVHSEYGTADTRQWLKVNNTDNIKKLRMTCTRVFSAASGKRPQSDEKDADDAGVVLFFEPLACAGTLGALFRGTDSELCLILLP